MILINGIIIILPIAITLSPLISSTIIISIIIFTIGYLREILCLLKQGSNTEMPRMQFSLRLIYIAQLALVSLRKQVSNTTMPRMQFSLRLINIAQLAFLSLRKQVSNTIMPNMQISTRLLYIA